MRDTPLSDFEEFTGISQRDMVNDSSTFDDDIGARRLSQIDLHELEDFLAEKQRQRTVPSYAPGELVPRLWPVRLYNEWVEDGPALTADIVTPTQVCAALLYAHRVEIPNPLLSALRSDYPPPKWQLWQALQAMFEIKPLLDAEIVTIGADASTSGTEKRTMASDLISAALRKAKGRAAYVGLTVLRFSMGDYYVGSDNDDESMITRRIEMMQMTLADDYDPDEARTVTEVGELLSSLMSSHADMWLPSPLLLQLVAAAHEVVTNGGDPVLTWAASLPIAYLGELDTRDQISIRLNSEVFEGWREALRASYEELQRKAALGLLDEADKSAAEGLQGRAEQVLKQLRPDLRKLWTGATRDLTVGLVAAAPGAALGSLENAVIGGIGGAIAGATGGATWDLIAPSRRRAASSLRRHAVALGRVVGKSQP